MRIEDYGLIGDLQTAALVGRDGSVDWLCLPRFDSASCFAALLGDERHGRLAAGAGGRDQRRLAPLPAGDADPRDRFRDGRRRGAGDRLHAAPGRGRAAARSASSRACGDGCRWRCRSALRPDYSASRAVAGAGPRRGSARRRGRTPFASAHPLPLHAEDGTVMSEFPAIEGARERFVLNWHPSHEAAPPVEDADSALARTEAAWREWSDRCTYEGPYRDAVVTSLIALKAMTNEVTGALVAAPTTSLPEEIGGVRNWDYRYCWLRDTALALTALLTNGYTEEALAFRDYLFRAADGRSLEAPDHVRDRGRAAPDRVRARRAPRLRGIEAGAGRQRRLRAVPARRLRRAGGRVAHQPDGHPAPSWASRFPPRPRSNGHAGWRWSSTWGASGASRTRASGR